MHVPVNEIHALNTHTLSEMPHHGSPLVRSLRIRKADVIGILVSINKINTCEYFFQNQILFKYFLAIFAIQIILQYK